MRGCWRWLHKTRIVVNEPAPWASPLGCGRYYTDVHPPDRGNTWIGLTRDALVVETLYEWSVLPSCGAVVVFGGTVRDHAEGRHGVTHLTYEAYDEMVEPQLARIVEEARRRWPGIGRIAVIHRIGRLELTDTSILVAVSAPHRSEAFDAARYALDAAKASVPIWKRESWADGDDWGTGATDLIDPADVGTPS